MTIGAYQKWYGMTIVKKLISLLERPYLGLYSTNTTKL